MPRLKPFGITITLDLSKDEPKVWIEVTRNGKKHWRRYKRPVKNGISDQEWFAIELARAAKRAHKAQNLMLEAPIWHTA